MSTTQRHSATAFLQTPLKKWNAHTHTQTYTLEHTRKKQSTNFLTHTNFWASDGFGQFFRFSARVFHTMDHPGFTSKLWHLRSRDHQGTSWFSQSTSVGCGASVTRMPWPRLFKGKIWCGKRSCQIFSIGSNWCGKNNATNQDWEW